MVEVRVFGDVDPLPLLASYGLEEEDCTIIHYAEFPDSAREVETICGLFMGERHEYLVYEEEVPEGIWLLGEDAPSWQSHMLNTYLSRRWDQYIVQVHGGGYWRVGGFSRQDFDKLCSL